MSCPDYQPLLLALRDSDAHLDENPVATEAARAHLDAGCPRCAPRVRVVRAMLSALEAGPLPEVPAALHERALALAVSSREPSPEPARARIRRFLGELLLDAGSGAAPALGLRGEGLAERHLLYRAGPFDVDLAHLDGGALVGQVLPQHDAAPSLRDGVCVLYGGPAPRQTPLDENGDFHFESVRAASYDLVLEAAELRLVLPDVHLGEEPD